MRNKKIGFRFFFLPVAIICWLVFILIKLVHLHSCGHETRNITRYHKQLPASRGIIYDRKGNALAVNLPGNIIYVDPNAPAATNKSIEKTAMRIADFLPDRSFEEIYKLMTETSKRRYIPLGTTFDENVVDISTNALFCRANIEPMSARVYPQGEYLSKLLGFTSGKDNVGRNGGIEQSFDSYLRGAPGFYIGVKSKTGKEIRERRITTVEPRDGASIYLTIDQNIQKVLHDALAKALENTGARGARGIVQYCDSGEILAMESLPTFDPVRYRDATPEQRKNKTITDSYDPGSTMKSVVVSAALNEGFITPDSVYDIGNPPWYYGGHLLRDHAHGKITVRQIIEKSSNIGAAKIGLALGNPRLEAYLRAFGFGKATGIDLPGEESGILRPHKYWETVTPTRISIGQSIAVTPIQMIGAYSCIANGGKLMRPYVISKIIESNSTNVLWQTEPKVIATPIKKSVADTMHDIMSGVVSSHGTARRAILEGYSSAGKTGTAQIVEHDENGKAYYSQKNYCASFIGYVPAENPVFTVLILLDAPKGSANEGGVVSAPVFKEVATYTARYLNIPQSTQGK